MVILLRVQNWQFNCDKQYGFRASRSTTDLLNVITERFYRALYRCGEARVVALDIIKAFNRV